MDEPASNFAFKFNLRLYIVAQRHGLSVSAAGVSLTTRQGLALVHFSSQPKPLWSHLPVSPCLIDWGKIMHPTYPTNCAYVEPESGRM